MAAYRQVYDMHVCCCEPCWEVVAAHHQVHDYACCHLQADCLWDRDQLRPLRSTTSMGTFIFTSTIPVCAWLTWCSPECRNLTVQCLLYHVTKPALSSFNMFSVLCCPVRLFNLWPGLSKRPNMCHMQRLLVSQLVWLLFVIAANHCQPYLVADVSRLHHISLWMFFSDILYDLLHC